MLRFGISVIIMFIAYRYGGLVYLGAALSGAIPFAWIAGKLIKGIDLRYIGSGNIGSTAIERALGKTWSRVIMILDMSKCAIPMWIAMSYHLEPWKIVTIAVFAVLGHCFSIFLKGRGGKGAGPALGAVLALEPSVALVTFVIWMIMRKVTKMVSISTITAAIVVIILQWTWSWPTPDHIYQQSLTVIAVLIILMHVKNIIKIIQGTERRIGEPEPEVDPWIGFVIHATSDDPEHTKRRVLDKVKRFPWLHNWMEKKPAKWFHDVIRPRLPIMQYATIQNVESAFNGNKANMTLLSLYETASELAKDKPRAAKRIVKAILKGVMKRGAKLAGLGAHTSIVAGDVVPKMLEGIIPVTSGNSLTVYYGIKVVMALHRITDKAPIFSTAVVIGGRGSIGKLCVKMLHGHNFGKIIIVGRDGSDMSETVQELNIPGLEWTTDIESALGQADLIISATSATGELDIDPFWIKSGAVGADLSRPRSFGEKLEQNRKDVLIVAGGLVKLPGKDLVSTFSMDLASDEVPACMAECFALALERRFESYSGKELTIEQVLEIGNIAEKHGFKVGSLRGCTDKAISDARLAEFFRSQTKEPISPSQIGLKIQTLKEILDEKSILTLIRELETILGSEGNSK